MNNILKVALAQISPVWLNKEKTIEKIEKSIKLDYLIREQVATIKEKLYA